jgi:hypothetical protein
MDGRWRAKMGRRGDWGLAEGAGGARGTERRVKPRERRGVGVVREGVVGMVRAGGGCRAREMPWLPVLRGDAGTRGEGVRYRTDDDNIWLFLAVGYIYISGNHQPHPLGALIDRWPTIRTRRTTRWQRASIVG